MEKVKKMKVVHLSTTVTDASANTRLHRALLKEGIDSKVITLAHTTDCPEIYDVKSLLTDKIRSRIRLVREYIVRKKYKNSVDKQFSYGINGIKLRTNNELLDADIIHLHWICNELSIEDIQELFRLRKKIVWTCHDSWAFTGGCHVRCDCERYQKECGMCKIIESDLERDCSFRILERKKRKWKLKKKQEPIYKERYSTGILSVRRIM